MSLNSTNLCHHYLFDTALGRRR